MQNFLCYAANWLFNMSRYSVFTTGSMDWKIAQKQGKINRFHWLDMDLTTLFFIRIPKFFRASIFLNFYGFEPRIILQLFLNTKSVTSPNNFRNIFQSFLMFYYIIKLSKSLYFVSIIQKYIWKQYYNQDTKNSVFFMKLQPRIILKLFLNFKDSGPQYSYKLYSHRKEFIQWVQEYTFCIIWGK